MVAEHDGDGRI